MHKIIVTKQTSHDLIKSVKINFFVIIYIIKSPTNCISIMIFPYYSLSMQCLKVSSLSLKTILSTLIFFVIFCYV
jgi:hypothetical protein